MLFALGDTHWLRDRADPARDRAFTRAFVSGLQLAPLAVESPPDSEMAGIRLRPRGAAAFLRDSPAAIAGSVIDLDALLGAGVESVRDQLASESDLRRRVLWLAAAVERHLEGARPLAPPLAAALGELARAAGKVQIRDLVKASGWSHRHFVERFRAEVGLAPKAFARVARFEAAFAKLQARGGSPGPISRSTAATTTKLHLIGEFRALAGATPTEVWRRQAPDGLGLLDEAEVRDRL